MGRELLVKEKRRGIRKRRRMDCRSETSEKEKEEKRVARALDLIWFKEGLSQANGKSLSRNYPLEKSLVGQERQHQMPWQC